MRPDGPALDPTDLNDASEAVHAAIAQVAWLRDCPPSTLTLLLRGVRVRTYEPGESVLRRGDRIDRLVLVMSGSLETSSSTAAGRRFVVSYVAPGHIVGLIPLLDGRGAIHDTVAHEPSRVMSIAGEDLLEAIDADRPLRHRVLKLLAARSRRLHVSLADTSTLPLDVRLARALLTLRAAYDTESVTDGDAIGLRVSQEGLAAMLGVPRQRINVELKALERDGVLRMAYLRVVLLDERLLRERAAEPGG
ncbi:MAG: Crp/Fnr family transcriptional regulator [Burkholderiaceae bacterium]